MGQVAFDTLQASEELQTAGLTSQQAKAISLVVRKSHEVADVATKADIVEVKHEIAEVNRNVADVRKDLTFQITDVRKDMEIVRKDLQLEMAGIRSEQKLIRWMLSALIAGMISLIIKAFFVASV
ncbi:hypothetical protein [Symbiopectobacterium purcellii]|uniref:hypothetical protein n=1 Tax=Symbiopectobacterium purcellii TaxID=2871826 RepID=UPI003F84D006